MEPLKQQTGKALHPINETVHLINPANGWLQNCNSRHLQWLAQIVRTQSKYPAYMAPDPENFRGINAVRTLSEGKDLYHRQTDSSRL